MVAVRDFVSLFCSMLKLTLPFVEVSMDVIQLASVVADTVTPSAATSL
jgi:hypothetical protein